MNPISLTSSEQRDLIKQTGARFEELGLDTKWLLGDCAGISACPRYARFISQNADVRPYLGPLAVHTWDVSDLQDEAIEMIGDYAREQDLELWVTEGGWDPFLWQRREEFPTWENALKQAAVYSRMLKLSGATVFQYWQLLGRDYSTNDGQEAFPILGVLDQFAREFPEGTQVVGTSPNAPSLFSVAAVAPTHFVVHLTHTGTKPISVRVTGIPDGLYNYVQSREGHIGQVVETYEVSGGAVTVELANQSVNVLTTRAP